MHPKYLCYGKKITLNMRSRFDIFHCHATFMASSRTSVSQNHYVAQACLYLMIHMWYVYIRAASWIGRTYNKYLIACSSFVLFYYRRTKRSSTTLSIAGSNSFIQWEIIKFISERFWRVVINCILLMLWSAYVDCVSKNTKFFSPIWIIVTLLCNWSIN